MLTLVAFLQAKPDKIEELAGILEGLVEPSRQEEGCIDYHFHQSASDPAEFVFYENWRDKTDFDRHGALPQLKFFWERRLEYLVTDVDIRFLNMRSNYPD